MSQTFTITETWPDDTGSYGLSASGGSVVFTPNPAGITIGRGYIEMGLEPKDSLRDHYFLLAGDGITWQFTPDTSSTTDNYCTVNISGSHYLAIEYNGASPSSSGVGGPDVSLIALDPTQTFYAIISTGGALEYRRSPTGLPGSWTVLGSVSITAPIVAKIRVNLTWNPGYPVGGGVHVDTPALGAVIYQYSLVTVDAPARSYYWNDLTIVPDKTLITLWNVLSKYYTPNVTGAFTGASQTFSPAKTI